MMSDLKEQLLARRIPEGEVELDLGTVRVRGLTRGEVFAINKAAGEDTEKLERLIVSRGLLDPEMTAGEAETWQRNSPAGEMEAVVAKIQALSGLAEGADKSGLPGVRGEPGSGVRALPGDEADDDGGPAAGADEQ